MTIIAVTQARSGSTRLPGKVLLPIADTTLLGLHLRRIADSKRIDALIVATTTAPSDVAIVELADAAGVVHYRGSEQDVLDRFYQAVKDRQPDYVVRLTSDCPLIDAALIDKVINFTITNKLDYASNVLDPSFPDGQDVEVFTFAALAKAWTEARLPSEREHVTPYIHKHSSFRGETLFTSDNYTEGYDYGHLRMTVDEPKDYRLMQALVARLGTEATWLTYAEALETDAALRAINAGIARNEGYDNSLQNDG